MSHPHGTYLGRIRTLPELRERCFVDDETDCWHWRGAMSAGVPRIYVQDPENGEAVVVTGNRAAWMLGTGAMPAKGLTVYRVRCTAVDCVNFAHFACGTKAEHGAHLRASKHLRGSAARSIINRRNGTKRSAYTPELRRLILESTEPATKLAPLLGLSHNTISLVRRGLRWADQAAANSSVFSWRGAV